MSKVTVVGSLNIDHVLKVKRLPSKGETVISKSYYFGSGGKGANQAVAIGRLGIEVNMIGKVGMDKPGDILIKNLSRSNVNTEGIIIDKDERTGAAFITVDDYGNNTIIVVPGANSKLSIGDINKRKNQLEDSNILIIQMEIPKDTIYYTIRYAKKLDKLVVLNYAPAIDIDRNILSDVDYLVVNEEEFRCLTQTEFNFDALNIAISKLRVFFSNILIITLGEKGSICITKENEILKIPSYLVKSIDTTGAGDAFIGGFVFGLIIGRNVMESTKLGNANGSLSATKLGAQYSLPNINELNDFLSLDQKIIEDC
jgi:ribokinase